VAAALAEVAIGLARNSCLSVGDWLDGHLRFLEQVIESAARVRVTAAIDDCRRFDIIDRVDAPMDGFSTVFANTGALTEVLR